MKKFFLSTLIIMNLSLVYAESPGSFRGNETHGFGFGIEGTGLAGSLFYDYAINSDMQIHAIASSGGISRGVGSTTLSSANTLIGATLRYFPSENYGFFVGGGGGMLSASQSLKQSVYCTSTRASTVTECSGKANSYISGSADSTYSGLALWGDFGWQGYDGYYFTIGAKGGTSMKLSEDDKTDEAIDVADHKSTTKSDWDKIKSPTGLIMSFGWHF
tara:strand:- start:660 stop:1310 length:651 start_codon:yes stop_codon:yes gene_type:complete